jgi:sigma-E factor negative regulatory protein RseB
MVVGVGAVGAALCSVGVGAVSSPRQEGPTATTPPISQPARMLSAAEHAAVDHLRRAAAAEATATYSGTKWVTGHAMGGVAVVEVRHAPARGTWLRVRTPVDGSAAAAQTVVDPAGAELDGEALAALSHQYTLAVRRSEPCSGRLATVVEARSLDTKRIAGRFWLDETTGLLLRRELYDAAGRMMRGTVFVSLDTGDRATPAPAGTTVVANRHAGRALEAPGLTQLRRDGWHLPDQLPGGLELYRAMEMTVDGHRVVQLAYSDGIFAASLFVQRGGLDPRSLRGFTRGRMAGASVYTGTGLHRTVVWTSSTALYTLVLDGPEPLAADVVAALPHTPVDNGFVARLSRGIQRVGSWANPFE